MPFRSLAMLSIALGLTSACPRRTSPQPAAPPPGDRQAPVEPRAELPAPEPSVPPPEPGPCSEGGWLWDGKPKDCSYEHEGCCYGSAADACQAAGCAADHCNVLESYPAQITCRG